MRVFDYIFKYKKIAQLEAIKAREEVAQLINHENEDHKYDYLQEQFTKLYDSLSFDPTDNWLSKKQYLKIKEAFDDLNVRKYNVSQRYKLPPAFEKEEKNYEKEDWFIRYLFFFNGIMGISIVIFLTAAAIQEKAWVPFMIGMLFPIPLLLLISIGAIYGAITGDI